MGSQQSTIPPPDTQPDEQEALRSAAPNEATPQQIESPPSSLISRAAQNRGQIVTSEGLVVHSIPGGLGISDTSEPTAENANTSAEGTGATPPADLSPAEAEALARRSMSFMIYFIPSEAGAAAGGLPTQTGTQTGAPTAQTNQGSGHPLGPGQPPSGSLRDALSEIAVLPSLFGEASSPSQGASNSTQATATAGNARQPGTASSDPPTGGAASPHTHRILPMQMQVSPRPARNIVEELAISIMLQIVTNMLREGSMNGPGGLLGGTLSLDIADELAMEDGAAGGGTGAGMPAGGGGMSYEDFLRLAELLGPARPRNATMDDVDRELPVFKFSDNSQVSMDIDGPPPLEPVEEDKGKGRKTETETEMETQEDKPTESSRRVSLRIEDLVPATREKCMICLSPYEADDEIRVMGCRHGFHKPCLDQWLTQYVNSCPLCREKAVSTTPTAPTTTTPTTPQTPFNPFTPLGRPPTSDEPLPFSVDTSRQTQDQTPPERRGFLRRIWEMFGSGGRNPAGGAPANANAGVDAGQTEGMERGTGLPAAVLVVLG
ncbi:uncharacterized protein EV422DRAFT_422015 [Fimicolochytrium jonesii]|uniref:uncharacterized protein n=1 Tax=Fimicolochytrium jonesii TaxID=1396493 RepID=UPI0022FDE782|nr:uncharacterized protein EV422DRAFT_422015 [Fimicolochytrium jonesii]KAI8822232.1 hypothetical protein EV422DRAFT_422015 [Fimicolochytrium jonesii]